MRNREEIEAKLEEVKKKIDFEIKNPPLDDDNKKVSQWVTNLGRLQGKIVSLKWVLDESERSTVEPTRAFDEKKITLNWIKNEGRKATPIRRIKVPESQSAINARNYLKNLKNEQD